MTMGNDCEDIGDVGKVSELVCDMQEAAEEDIALNWKGEPTVKKIHMLPRAVPLLRKHYLQNTFLEYGLLTVLKTWLAPLPDQSLQPLQVREDILQLLLEFPGIDKSLLKESGIGKAVMYLHEHPKETRGNKKRARTLIDKWARLIYNKSTDYKALPREERTRRDLWLLPAARGGEQQRRPRPRAFLADLCPGAAADGPPARGCDAPAAATASAATAAAARRAGAKGWALRARAPAASTKAYIFRPSGAAAAAAASAAAAAPGPAPRPARGCVSAKKCPPSGRPLRVSIDGRNITFYEDDKG